MADYLFVVCSDSFQVKEEAIEGMRTALSYFEESEVDSKGNCFIGSYGEQCYTDDLKVVIDKRTNKVLGTYDSGYWSLEDFIEENGANIEEALAENNIVDTKETYDIEDFQELDFADFIQQNLAEGEHVFIKEVGHEKLRYACGCGFLITKDKQVWIDLEQIKDKVLTGELTI